MICGTGVDIIEIDRIKKAIQRSSFVSRVFTESEREICLSKSNYGAALAVRFAAKEAVLKALGTGLRGCKWKDIEILSLPKGQPQVVLYGGAKNIAAQKGITNIHITLSHSRGNAIAICIMEGEGVADEVGDCGRNALS
ncbi:MAG: holo-ACP synthase [Bacillota bacterium]|jgi:holo-[acyl-carrier protein] synthase